MEKESSCCCGGTPAGCGCGPQKITLEKIPDEIPKYITGLIDTPAGKVPVVSTNLGGNDRKGGILARWTNKRMGYRVTPGLYAVGNPGTESQVLVSANYKLSFDALRKELTGIDAWMLVLDTKGINVWCAAGKGTFGTDEIVHRVKMVNLEEVVSHKKLILPQLGAPGVAAHKVKEKSGFKVIYGPVYAKDLPLFLDNGLKKSPQMRRVHFTMKDRLTLVPMEVIPGLIYGLYILIPVLILDLLKGEAITRNLLVDSSVWLVTILAGGLVMPLLMPWIPGRSFAWKGWLTGLVFAAAAGYLFCDGPMEMAIMMLFFPPLASYIAVNFTGSSTFTSLSGVVKELKYALPLMIVSVFIGLVLRIYSYFPGGS